METDKILEVRILRLNKWGEEIKRKTELSNRIRISVYFDHDNHYIQFKEGSSRLVVSKLFHELGDRILYRGKK